MHGFRGWETVDGEIIGREVVLVLHPECYMRLSPAERMALLKARARES
jgi:hypothetical protein